MRLLTISTADWTERHLKRWIRKAKESNPNAELYLVFIGDTCRYSDSFKAVKYYGEESHNRNFYNHVRMNACEIFGVDEMVYCDCDADILGNLTWIDGIDKVPLRFVRSPAMHDDWVGVCKEAGWNKWEANNGFLVLRSKDDFLLKMYEQAEKATDEDIKPNPRIRGTIAFNLMLRTNPYVWGELPYSTSVIWWDHENIMDAKTVQYCSDRGQEKREELEFLHEQNMYINSK